ncbi:MAG: hypothetical protein EZS28_016783 [Streblomastix strix]|uniref:Uncharacterized protein n=1 Tax=Streblomastix strix TaxID=222440 RepID=A0A5J4VYT3_9EUKA|nr:MAG: hypothetical protein EZS28_016783 [Streblomastix strix]
MIHHFYTIGLRIDLDQLIAPDSELDEIDPNVPTIIDQTADDGYSYYDQIYFALYSVFHTRARFIHRLGEFPDPLGPVGDPTTKHIRPPPTPTSGLQPSRFSQPCFALSMLR